MTGVSREPTQSVCWSHYLIIYLSISEMYESVLQRPVFTLHSFICYGLSQINCPRVIITKWIFFCQRRWGTRQTQHFLYPRGFINTSQHEALKRTAASLSVTQPWRAPAAFPACERWVLMRGFIRTNRVSWATLLPVDNVGQMMAN